VEEAIAEYASYLHTERGLAAETVEHQAVLVRPFLTGRIRDDGFRDLKSLTAADVQALVLDRARRSSPAPGPDTGTALRSLLRFLHLRGITSSPLASAVPAAAGWKLAGLPRHLAQGEAARMVASCDLATSTGRRDRAVLLLPGCGWMTSTGALARLPCAAREAGTSGCPCRPTSEKPCCRRPTGPGPGPRSVRRGPGPAPAADPRGSDADRGPRLAALRPGNRLRAPPAAHRWRKSRQVLRHRRTLTTAIYADLAIKEKALARTAPLDVQAGRYQPPDADRWQFLESL